MDGFINSSTEKQTIYEIYRACRLCGAGAGYKMPIMQNVVHLDGAEIELRQKIRECVQIEVHQEDKMPPLICELCVDKVNDFYEFLEMCRQTNKRTRLRLGLPPQTMPREASDAGDCILGMTEPVYLNEDSNESLLKPRARNKGKFTKVAETAKKNQALQNEVRSLRSKNLSPPPQRSSKRLREEDIALSKLQKTRQSVAIPKSILRKEREIKVEEEWSPTRSKRSRDSRDSKPEIAKRVKIVEKPLAVKPNVKSDFKCKACKTQFNNNKALNNHMRIHNRPQPKYKSTPKQEKKNICSKCKKDFPTKLSLDRHKCTTNKCGNCGRHISNVRNLVNHERACRNKKEFKISPKLLKQLRPIQIRVKRCDQLLQRVGERYDISGVDCNFGLDKNCIYPYLTSLRIKTEPSYMVNIHDTIDDFDLNEDYVHWDSDSCESDLEMSDLREKSVETLANLSLRTIFSHKFLGKVPRRKRRVKHVKSHDSLLNFNSDVRLGIDNIINSLDNENVNNTKDNDSLFGDDKTPAVSNDDFDSLFTSNNDSESNLSGDKRKSDEKCEIVNKIIEIEDKNIIEVNKDNLTQLDSNDTIKNTQDVKSDSSEEVPDVSSINNKNHDNEKHSENSAKQQTIEDSDVKDNEEIMLKNNENIDKVDTNEKQSSSSTNYEKLERTDNVIENNDSVSNNKVDVVNDSDRDSNIPVNDSDGDSNIPVNDSDRDSNIPVNDNDRDSNIPVNDSDQDSNIPVNDSDRESNIPVNDSEPENYIPVNDSDQDSNIPVNDSDRDSNIPVNISYVAVDVAPHIELSRDVENNDSQNNDNMINDAPLNDTNNDNKLDNDAVHVNGDDKLNLDDLEDISDSEVDDSRLMDAIDEQIGEKDIEDTPQVNEDSSQSRESVSVVKSADLESISSEELLNE